MHELGHRARPDRTDVARLVAHRVEHRLMFVEHCLVATDPDRELAAIGSARSAADRRIEQRNPFFGELRMHLPDQTDRVGGKVEPHRTFAEPMHHAVFAETDGFNVRRRGQRGEHHVALFGNGARTFGPVRPGVEMVRRRLPAQIVHNQLVSRLLQVAGHAGAHHPKSDKSDWHRRSLRLPGGV